MLHQATRLAVKGHGSVEPNPMVGCIITNDKGEILGEGYHEKYGEAHAEVNALSMAGNAAKGGTAYVSLEPCNHHGKTPPCSSALLEAGIERVVIGTSDPHEIANGGASFLKENGVEVEIVDDEFCNEVIAPFAHRVKTGLPWITCKWAQTIDGNLETPRSESNWISCKESQQLVHEERGCVDAILVGVGTIVADNPSLTARGKNKYRTPLRVVIDPSLRTPPNSKILNQDAPTLIAHASGANTEPFTSCELLELPSIDGELNLIPLFEHLVTKYDATNVIAEGGATLFKYLFAKNLANELWVFTAESKSTFTPKINMNTLVESISTNLLDEQPCGVDTVRRFSINN